MLELHILPTPERAAWAAADLIVTLSEERTRAQDYFTIALSGGSTPQRLYELLSSESFARRLHCERWHVFWSDERCVPPNHPESNYRLAKESFLDKVSIPSHQVHRMRGELTPKDAAEEYEVALRQEFPSSSPIFDLMLLGMGDDGHTASLFPGTDALHEKRRWVVANWVPLLRAYRITFTLPLINMARVIAFLVTQKSKAELLKQVLEPEEGQELPPAALVRPTEGVVHWFLTAEAASKLHGTSEIEANGEYS